MRVFMSERLDGLPSQRKYLNGNLNADGRPRQNKKQLLQYRGKRPDGTWCSDELNNSSSHPGENELSDWTTKHFPSDFEHVVFEKDRSIDMKFACIQPLASRHSRMSGMTLLKLNPERLERNVGTSGDKQKYSDGISSADAHIRQNKKELLQYRGKRPDGTPCTDESNISSAHPEANELSDWTTSPFHSDWEHVMFDINRSVDLKQKCSNDNSNADGRPRQNKKEWLQYRGKRSNGTWCTDGSNNSSSHPGENELSDWTTSHFHSDSEHVMFEMDCSVDMEDTECPKVYQLVVR
ncbi:hypothetical protein KIN20_029243 [Parelaphostrongylus tenuis]|uniref:Uncharacterized protein n=1 Tax=Parelaphostrongylus tenuis TaxID=148309 RepID=A0AAD5WFU2_PARTN|nr:hypothetical protein KIN20_029243 [Parelaphostrongylus tenuis]